MNLSGLRALARGVEWSRMPPDTLSSRTDRLRAIRDEVLNFTASPLHAERVRNGVFPVIGEGSHEAAIMFVGEAPGKTEAATGRPFCGASGRVLDELLAAAGLNRPEVYITNIVKDRPPMNRDPSPEEILLYAPFLDRQIEIIRPKVIGTLGRFSMEYLLRRYGLGDRFDVISRIHGRVFRTTAPYGALTIVPLFHPAVAIYDRAKKETLIADMKTLASVVE